MSDIPRLAPRIVERTLENGLRLVLLPDRTSTLVAINLWYHVGSKDDPPGRSGLAHLFEHMLFQGSQHVGANEHFRLVQQFGGVTNASTSFDRTNYYETLPAHCLELGLWLESDRLGFLLPALTEEKFEGQRAVVINERHQRVDNQPYGRAFEMIQGELFPEAHPYSWPIIGHLEDIQAARLKEVAAFFRAHYTPSNAVLTLVGSIDIENTEALVSEYFGSLPSDSANATPNPPSTAPRSPSRTTGRHLLLEDNVALPRTYFAWPGPPLVDRDRYAGEILATALTGGKSSPLYQDLVQERQIAQDVSTFLLPLELGSLFIAAATAKPGVELQRVEERLASHITAAALEPPARSDLGRARNQIATGFFEQMQSVENVADLLSYAATYFGSARAVDEEADRYLSRDADDLLRFANDYLQLEEAVTLRVVPQDEAGSAT